MSLSILYVFNPITRLESSFFISDVIVRIIIIFLSLAGLVIYVGLIDKFLINAKKDQLEKNNEHVMGVLNSVQLLSERLHDAGKSLSQISENDNINQ